MIKVFKGSDEDALTDNINKFIRSHDVRNYHLKLAATSIQNECIIVIILCY